MEHFDIPRSFLKLPLVSNITEEPNQNYKLPLRGQIHGEKYRELLDLVATTGSEEWHSKAGDILHGNVIGDELQTLSFSQFLDYLVHIAYANPTIDWNSISILEQFLDQRYQHVPRWSLPDLDFTEDLHAFFASRLKIEMESPLIDHLDAIIKQLKIEFSSSEMEFILPSETLRKIKSNSMMNLKDYFDFLINISVIQQTGLIRYEKFSEFSHELAKSTEKLLQDSIFDVPFKKLLFIVYYIMVYIKDDPVLIEKCQHLHNLAVSHSNKLDEGKKRSYMWLIDAVKAMVVNEVTKFNMEMVTEDLLLRSIGERFLNPENADLQTWMHALDNSSLPDDIIIILIRGYLSVEQIIHRYYLQLPKTDTGNLVTLNNFVMSLLKSFDEMYIKKIQNNSEVLSFGMNFFLIESWAKAGFNQAKITPKKNYSAEPLAMKRVEDSIFSDYFEIMMTCNEIINGTYDFDTFLQEIMLTDNEDFTHLIGNEAFARIFVDRFAKAFNYAQQRQINGVGVPIHSYVQLTYFLQSWLPHLLKIEELIQDTIIMFLSFLKVVVNMIEAYYSEKGRFKSAKLWDLNYTLFELNLFVLYGYPQLRNINKMLSAENIFNDFLKMLQHFDLNREITTVDKRYLAIDTVYDVSKFGLSQTQSSVKPEKLLEHNIMEYLEMRNSLDTFLNDLGMISIDEMKSYFQHKPFKARKPPLTLLDHLNFSNHIPDLNFPFIQPLHAFAAAIQFFDLEIEFPTISIKESDVPKSTSSSKIKNEKLNRND